MDGIEAIRQMPSGSVHLFLTDIPYGDGYVSHHLQAGPSDPILNDTPEESIALAEQFFAEAWRVVVPWGVLATTGPYGTQERLERLVAFGRAMAAAGWHRSYDLAGADDASDGIWDKVVPGMGNRFEGPRYQAEAILVGTRCDKGWTWTPEDRRQGNVIRVTRPNGGRSKDQGDRHQSEKPTGLGSALASLYAYPGEVVVDPFAGGGSLVLGALMAGRVAIGFELLQENVDRANARIDAWRESQ